MDEDIFLRILKHQRNVRSIQYCYLERTSKVALYIFTWILAIFYRAVIYYELRVRISCLLDNTLFWSLSLHFLIFLLYILLPFQSRV